MTMEENEKSTIKNYELKLGESENLFKFWNGDEYTGQFAGLMEKQKLVMEGSGVYKTAENEIYQGIWENDELKEAKRIVYKDKSEFSGTLNNMVIQGPGRYKFKENVEIEGEFADNTLIGQIHLVDPNDHLWKENTESKTEIETNFSILTPLHPFWQSVLYMPSRNFDYFNGSAEEEEETFDYEDSQNNFYDE